MCGGGALSLSIKSATIDMYICRHTILEGRGEGEGERMREKERKRENVRERRERTVLVCL